MTPISSLHASSPAWLRPGTDGCMLLAVQVVPNAPKTWIDGLHGSPGEAALKVRLNALPRDGKANEALVRWLADVLGIAQRSVTVTRGQTSRKKLLQVSAAAAVHANWAGLISLADNTRITHGIKRSTLSI